MTVYQLHIDGDCGFSCPVCAHEDEEVAALLAEEQAAPEETIAERIEWATGLNGEKTLRQLEAEGLAVVVKA